MEVITQNECHKAEVPSNWRYLLLALVMLSMSGLSSASTEKTHGIRQTLPAVDGLCTCTIGAPFQFVHAPF